MADLESSICAGQTMSRLSDRTDDLFITSDHICVDWCRLTWADVPLTCRYSDPLSAGVGRNRMRLAPR
jgi:hypothetical protein